MKRSISFLLMGLVGLAFLIPITSSLSAGTLKVTTPNAVQAWTVGKKYVIKWDKGNAGAHVKIQLLKSGKHYKWITKKTKNDGKHPWKVPASIATGSAYKIKITSIKNKKVFDKSNRNFSITKASSKKKGNKQKPLKVTTPNAGQAWIVGKKYVIKWDKGNAGAHVKIQLLKSNKHNKWISKKTKNDGKYVWKVPASVATGSAYKIKITSTKNKKVFDKSNKNFSLKSGTTPQVSKVNATKEVEADSQGSGAGTVVVTAGGVDKRKAAIRASGFTITKPAKGEEWIYGKRYEIQWEKAPHGTHVRIQLYGGNCSWPLRINSRCDLTLRTENDGSYSWEVPTNLTPATDYNFKIESFTYNWVCQVYYNPPYDSWGLHKALVRRPKGDVHYEKVWGVRNWPTADEAKESVLSSCTASYSDCELLDVDGNNCTSSASDRGKANKFTIAKTKSDDSKLTVTTPNGGQKWKTGKSYTLKWTHKTAGAKVKIQLLKSGKQSLWISKSTKNDGEHSWKIPSTVATGSAYTIKITSSTKKTVTDSSDSNFTITKAGGGGSSLKVSTPNGGESWTTGKSYVIKWSKGNAGAKVKIELLKSGKKSLTISKKTKNDGKHKWKVPSTVKTGSKYKIKITSSTKKTVTDSSDSNFTITKAGGGGSSLKVSTPNGGESWTTGKSYVIKWSKGNAGAKVKIELLKSGKASLTISKKTKNDGKHKWKVPSTVKTGSAYKIKITSSTKKTVTDSSDSNFTITKASTATPTVSLSCTPSSFSENGGTSTCSLTLSKSTTKAVTVKLGYSGTATAGTDYSGHYASRTIAKGKTSASWTLTGKSDTVSESNESIVIDISSVTNATEKGTQKETLTLEDDSVETCTLKIAVIGLDGWTAYPGKKVCIGKTPTHPDLVCATTKAADGNVATFKNVPKENLNIYPCGSSYKYTHGTRPDIFCDDSITVHASSYNPQASAAAKEDWDKKCGW